MMMHVDDENIPLFETNSVDELRSNWGKRVDVRNRHQTNEDFVFSSFQHEKRMYLNRFNYESKRSKFFNYLRFLEIKRNGQWPIRFLFGYSQDRDKKIVENSNRITLFRYGFVDLIPWILLLTFLFVTGTILDCKFAGAYALPVQSTTTESTLDVLRDQSGTSPREVEERARRCSNINQLLCTHDELEASSVCGSDGRTYSSICEIKKMACHGNPVDVIDKSGPCPVKKKCLLERAFQKESSKRRNQTDIVIPECEADGSYSPVQCHKETGFCWCVTNTGRPIPTTSVQFKRPDCVPQGCSTADRSTFSSNLIRMFRDEYEKETRKRTASARDEDGPADLVALRTKQITEWKFEQLDTNHDRLINPRESIELRRIIRDHVQPKACARRFAKYCDLDNDKRITRTEWSLCLGVDISMSFRLFHSLNTSDELQRQELQQASGTSTPLTDADEDEPEDPIEDAMDELSTTAVPFSRMDNIEQRSIGNRQRHNEQRRNNGQNQDGRQRQRLQSGGQRQSRLQSQLQQAQRRHASGAGGRLNGDVLVEASRNVASSTSGFSFLSERTQKAEKEEVEATDCQSSRRRAQEDHQHNPESGVYIPRCQNIPDSNGVSGRLFERVQCHDLAGFCWCADPETGKPIPGTQKKLDKPDCGPVQVVSKSSAQNSDGEIKGCTNKKRTDFLKRLHGTLITGMVASGYSGNEDMSRVEGALRWKFDELDKNKNKVLERKEWKPYRLELKTWKGLRKCGRNFLRSCDSNNDRRITLSEWLTCAGNSLRAISSTVTPSNRRGPNPFINVLDPNQ